MHQCGELCDTHVGRVVGAHPRELPQRGVDGGQSELMAEEVVFPLQESLIIVRRSLFQQSRLPEEERLDLLRMVLVLRQAGDGQGLRQLVEGLGIGVHAETLGEQAVEDLRPIVAALFQEGEDLLRLAAQP